MENTKIVKEQIEEAYRKQFTVHIVIEGVNRKSIFTATKILEVGDDNFVFLDKFGTKSVLSFSSIIQLNLMPNYNKKIDNRGDLYE